MNALNVGSILVCWSRKSVTTGASATCACQNTMASDSNERAIKARKKAERNAIVSLTRANRWPAAGNNSLNSKNNSLNSKNNSYYFENNSYYFFRYGTY